MLLMPKTPIDVVGGFLGAGKTTLLRNMLSAPSLPEKIALMINEIGDVVVDAQVLKKSGGNVVELPNGCICCSVSGDFVQGLLDLKKDYSPDRIFIEPTGIAEPGRLLSALYRPPLEPEFRIDPTVIVIDASSFLRCYKELEYLYVMQIKTADIILLNKADLATKSVTDKTEKAVRALNSRAVILRTEQSRVDLFNLFEGIKPAAPSSIAAGTKLKQPVFESFSFKSNSTFSQAKIEKFLDRQTANIFRVKGFIRVEEGMKLLNYTAGQTEWEPFEPTDNQTTLTVIGARLVRDKWISQINQAVIGKKGESHAKSEHILNR